MLNKVELCYFSPTGGTKKVGEILAGFLADQVEAVDMGSGKAGTCTDCSAAVIAAPVFAGRIPTFAAEWLKHYPGEGKNVITVAVYGNRAYEDALLELNDLLRARGARIAGSAAFVAQHSIVPEVGTGRPDEQDATQIREFAQAVLKKLESGADTEIQVPGNRPYKETSPMPAAPMTLPSCTECGTCERVCPVKAVQITDGKAVTDTEKCMFCMACAAHCPEHARILPPPVQEKLGTMLGKFKEFRNKNEWFV